MPPEEPQDRTAVQGETRKEPVTFYDLLYGDAELISWAMSRYFKEFAHTLLDQPSNASYVSEDPEGNALIHLVNARGTLAVYKYDPRKDELHRIELSEEDA
jgi:hypothetical protein